MDFETALMPFTFRFMQSAFYMAIMVAIPTALLSCFLVLKGWALMGDAVSHAVLPGIVLAYIFGFPLILGAFAAGMTCALATGYLSQHSQIKNDTIMGVVFSGMFAIGLVLYVSIDTNAHLDHILFGNILGVEAKELLTTGLISAVVTVAVALKWKDLLFCIFDETQAQAAGLSVKGLHYGLLAILSLTIVSTLAATGIILAIGLLIAPGAIAFLVVRSFGAMLVTAVVVSVTSMLLGTYLSFFLDSAPAPTVVLVLTALFLIAFFCRLMVTKKASRRRGRAQAFS